MNKYIADYLQSVSLPIIAFFLLEVWINFRFYKGKGALNKKQYEFMQVPILFVIAGMVFPTIFALTSSTITNAFKKSIINMFSYCTVGMWFFILTVFLMYAILLNWHEAGVVVSQINSLKQDSSSQNKNNPHLK